MIEAIGLTKRFGDITAVDHINARIREGNVFGLIGTNGAGKSTFLRMAAGILKPDEGQIQIDGAEAIGTGKTATADQAQEVCKGIRDLIAEIYNEETAEAVRIQYGGSMNAGNAKELLAKPDIDGGLIGGASLKKDFGDIVNA